MSYELSSMHPLIAEERMMPSQFYESPADSTPERRLLMAMLDEAWGTALTCRDAVTPAAMAALRELRHWLESREMTYVFSFIPACEALGFEPDAVRVQFFRVIGHERDDRLAKVRVLRRTKTMRIRRTIREHIGRRAFTSDELIGHLGTASMASIGGALGHMAKRGELEVLGPGVWRSPAAAVR